MHRISFSPNFPPLCVILYVWVIVAAELLLLNGAEIIKKHAEVCPICRVAHALAGRVRLLSHTLSEAWGMSLHENLHI